MITLDFESRSPVDLRKTGAQVYAEHPDTEVMCMAWKLDDEPTLIWVPEKFLRLLPSDHGLPLSGLEFLDHIKSGMILEAHNAGFERAIWESICFSRYHWPLLPPNQWQCSAAKAAACALPRDLAGAGAALGLDIQKDQEGHRLMLKLCKPRRPRKAEKEANPNWEKELYWHEKPEELLREFQYCIRDVDSERRLSQSLRDLSSKEKKVWQLDQEINSRGVYIDTRSVKAAIQMIHAHENKEIKKLRDITQGEVESPRQVAKMLIALSSRGVDLKDLTKASVSAALDNNNLPEDARKILKIRQSLGRSSTAKYEAMLLRAGYDNRARDLLLYHGASTGRWSGRGIQPQNMPRGTFSDVEDCLKLVQEGNLDRLELMYGEPMEALSTCLRGVLAAEPGNVFMCADFSSIEARVNAWLAGEQHVLDAFISGKDLYKVAAMAIYHKAYDQITKAERQVGKVAVLALGYQGSIGAFQSMAINYGIIVPDDEVKEIVTAWRADHQRIVNFWGHMEHAALAAVKNPGKAFRSNGIVWGVHDKFLLCKLPSGRLLSYYDPIVIHKETPWKQMKEVVSFMGIDTYTRKWSLQYTYGGKLVENVVQATARDLMVESMLTVEAAGYPIVLTVHDEIVAEVPKNFGSLEEFCRLMSVAPEWAEGCPIEADGWTGTRYRK